MGVLVMLSRNGPCGGRHSTRYRFCAGTPGDVAALNRQGDTTQYLYHHHETSLASIIFC